MTTILPREYQIEALEAVASARTRGITRQLISLPTGCGKTVVFALLAKEFNGKTLVIAHTEELISQAVAKLKTVWPEADIGIVKAKSDEVDAQVVVASIQTISRDRRLQRLKDQNFELLIIDEAHHAAATSYMKVVKELGFFNDDNNKLLVGVTATPKRGDGVGLNSIFQEIIFDRSMSTMIRSGYLSPLVGKQILTEIELHNVGTRKGDFVPSELAKIINIPERNQLIIDNYKRYAGNREKTLAFCANVQHAKDLAEYFNQNGIPAKAIYGTMDNDERASVLDGFSNRKYAVLTNCQILTEGFDEPGINCIIMGRPTQSAALFTQMIGRGTRTSDQKKDCLVLDFTDNASKHTLCTYKNTLDGAISSLFELESKECGNLSVESSNDKIVDSRAYNEAHVIEKRIDDIEFFNNIHFPWDKVGDVLYLPLACNRAVWIREVEGGCTVIAHNGKEVIKLSSGPVSLDYAIGISEDWAHKQTTKGALNRKNAEWRLDPPTEKQIETMNKCGIRFDVGITKGEACQLLNSKFNEPPTYKQISFLRHHKSLPNHPITKLEARKIISRIKGY